MFGVLSIKTENPIIREGSQRVTSFDDGLTLMIIMVNLGLPSNYNRSSIFMLRLNLST